MRAKPSQATPRLAAEITSTAAKPSTILPRNRKAGSFGNTDCGLTRFNQTTSAPIPTPIDPASVGFPNPPSKGEQEWIKSRKFPKDPHPEERPLARVSKDGPGSMVRDAPLRD